MDNRANINLAIIILSLVFSLCSCKAKKHVQSEGNYVHGLEEGEWKFYDSAGVVQEKGRFKGGFLTGPWEFYYDSVKSIINWHPVACQINKDLTVSLPSFYEISENKKNIDLYAFNPKQPNNNFFFSFYPKPIKYTLYELVKSGHEEVQANAPIIDYSIQKAENDSGIFYSNYFVITNPKDSTTWLMYDYLAERSNYIIDVVYKTEFELPATHKMIFTDVLMHSTYKGARLLDPNLKVWEL